MGKTEGRNRWKERQREREKKEGKKETLYYPWLKSGIDIPVKRASGLQTYKRYNFNTSAR
jgi:hypothetical protein